MADIILYTPSDLDTPIRSDDPNIAADKYESAVVNDGQWIVYDAPNYGPKGGTTKSQVLTKASGRQRLAFSNVRSIRRVNTFESDGVVVYEHPNYCGDQEAIYSSVGQLNLGVSSMIVSGGRWELYTKENFEHVQKRMPVELGIGKYANPEEMGFPGDKLKSIRKHDSTMITLYTEATLELPVNSDNPNIEEDNYRFAVVNDGQWIVYSATDYGPRGGTTKSQILTKAGGRQTLNFSNVRSIRRVTTFDTEGVVVYEHPNYCGDQEAISRSVPKLKLPAVPYYGVSSMIISGGTWELYKHADYEPPEKVLGMGEFANPEQMHFPGDKLVSIKKVGSTMGNIILYTSNASDKGVPINSDDPNVSVAKYESALVNDGQWIVYSATNYGPRGGTTKSQVLTQAGGRQTLNFNDVRSVRRVTTFDTEGVVVYEHPNYCGDQEAISRSVPKLKLPAVPYYGVSSMIISGGTWELYKHADYEPPEKVLGMGKFANPDEMHFPGDKLKSIKKL